MSELSTDQYVSPSIPTTPAKSGLNDNQKKVLGISAAAMLLGGAAWAITHQPPVEPTDGTASETAETTPPTITLPDDVDVAGKVTDEMSFGQAFAAARDEVGMGGVFSWHGHWYNTFDKEEWSGLSLEQRQTYTEQIMGEKLPVVSYHQYVAQETGQAAESPAEPTIIEGHLNGRPVMGLDYNHDGVIDVLVMDGEDGNIYRVVDAVGNDGLDTIYQYNSLTGEQTAAIKLDHPIVLSNDQFSQGLEESMSREVVESILDTDADAPTPTEATGEAATETTPDMDEAGNVENNNDGPVMLADSHEPDDTYVNNGDVQDMDE